MYQIHRTHLLGIGLTFSAMLSVAAIAQPSAASAAGTAKVASTTAPATASPLPAKTLIDQAIALAKKENKTVFVQVGASWCGWCHRLDHALHSKELEPIITAHYVLVPLDALEQDDKKSLENPGVDSVMTALGLHGGPPLYAFIDANGKELATSFALPNNENIGYPALPQEVKAFGDLLQKTAPSMTEADRTTVTNYLTANAPKHE